MYVEGFFDIFDFRIIVVLELLITQVISDLRVGFDSLEAEGVGVGRVVGFFTTSRILWFRNGLDFLCCEGPDLPDF